MKAAVEMMNGEDKMQLVGDLVKHKQSSDAENSNSSGGGSSNTDKTAEKVANATETKRPRTHTTPRHAEAMESADEGV